MADLRTQIIPSPPLPNISPATEAKALTVNELYAVIGWTKYHTLLFIVCGLGWMADSIETGLLGFLKQQIKNQWELGTYELGLLQNLVFVGEIIGCFIWGPIADRFGRRPAFLLANLFLFVCGLASAAAPSFTWLVCFRFLVGCGIGGITIPYDMLLECSPPLMMNQVMFGVQYFWTFGSIYANLVAALVLPRDFESVEPWRILTVACALPIMLCIIGFFFIKESPSWLQEQGRDTDTLVVLSRIARSSQVDISGYTLQPHNHEETPALCDVLKKPYGKRTVVLSMIVLLGCMGYYGASLTDPVIFDTSKGTNYGLIFFTACGEVLGVVAMSLVTWKVDLLNSLPVFFMLAGLFIFSILLENMMPKVVLAIIVFITRALVMSCSCGYYLAAPKAYPTYIRGSGHSFVNIFGRMGGLLATVAEVLEINVQLGMYGVANLLCAIITFAFRGTLQARECP